MTRNDSPGPVARGVTVFGVLLLVAWSALGADVKISDLPETNAPSAIAVSPLVQNGVTWKVQRQNYLGPLTNITQSGSPPVPLWAGGAWPAGADPTWTNGFTRVYNVKLFGATGNGSTDDTAAIQAAIDACDNGNGGTVYLPNGTYKITGTNGLLVANANLSHGGQHYVSLRGESAVQTVLSYSGPTNGVAIVLRTDKYATLETMTIHRNGARGTTAGLLFTGPNSGTQSNGGIVRNVGFDGWHICIDAGPDSGFSGTSSEWVFDSVSFNTSDIGFANFDFNGLDFMFRMLQCANVTTNVYGVTAGITVDGGSFSSCGTGFYCRNGGLFSIRNVRSEVESGPFVDSQSTVLIENCLVHVSDTNSPAIKLTGGSATIKMCQLGAFIGATNTSSLDVEDTGINAQSVATIGGTNGQLTYLRDYQTQGQTSAIASMFSDNFQLNGQSPSKAAAFDAATNLVSAAPTLTELNLLSGASSPLHYGAVGNGLTNSAGTIGVALVAGNNMTFTTNNGQITMSSTSSGSGAPTGTIINSGTSTANSVPYFTDTTGTNIAASSVQITGSTNIVIPSNGGVQFTNETTVVRDRANSLALRNGTSGQALFIYNTFTGGDAFSGTNEVGGLFWNSNVLELMTGKNGTGTQRDLAIYQGGSQKWKFQASDGGLYPNNDNSQAIGFATGRVRDVWNGGAVTGGIITKTTNYTAGAHDYTILANGTTLTITLPTAVGVSGQEYIVKVIANSTATVGTTSSQNIDGATTYSLSAQYKFVRVQSDGTQWWIIGSN